MKSFIGERGSGKTTALIIESHKTGKYIVVGNRVQVKYILEMSQELGLNIPCPITLVEVMRGRISKRIRREGILVDEAPTLLESVLDAQIHMYTASKDEVSND